MSFMNSSKHFNTAVLNFKQKYVICKRWHDTLLQPLPTSNLINCRTTGQNCIQFWMQVTK